MMKPQSKGFTLIELTVVLVIAALVLVVSVPNVSKIADSRDYRASVREVVSAAQKAKKRAVHRNRPVDLVLEADTLRVAIVDAGEVPSEAAFTSLLGELEMSVTTAADVSPGDGLSAIRFYPRGGSTGGDIALVRESGAGTLIQVGWLLADVKQSPM